MNYDITVEEPISLSLTPYTGTWSKAEAAHLLRRTLLGPTNQQIIDAVGLGMNASVAALLTTPAIAPPIVYETDEAVAPMGSTWVNSLFPASNKQVTQATRNRSLLGWLGERLNDNQFSIIEKMSLFWQNHFACQGNNDANSDYNYLELLRNNALGNFKQLVIDITIDPIMLNFLNGNTNNVFAPNENFSRELLELYTIGKGPQIGPGDYTNYTELDVAEGAKILTGWVDVYYQSETAPPSSNFYPFLHDTTTKTLSSKFGNAVINDNGANEYIDYINIIFQQPACATFICQKLYRYFVNYDLTSSVETTVIADMAATLLANNYDILPVLDELFKSQHFYDVALRGTIIRSPIEMLYGLCNATYSIPSYDTATNFGLHMNLLFVADALGQNYGAPPSVGGWPAYYLAPSFSRLWMNSSLIKLRSDFAALQTVYGGLSVNGNSFAINALDFLDNLTIPNDATTVINDIITVFCPKDLTAADKAILKAILTNGLPDFEWTIQYTEYQNNPGNVTYSDPVKFRVQLVLAKVFRMAQFQCI